MAHGAGAEWNARVRETVAQVQWLNGPVTVAFLMGPEAATAGWEAGLSGLVNAGAKEVVAVPLMVPTHGSHVRQIEYYAGLRGALPAELMAHGGHGAPHALPPVPVRVTSALDAAPELGVALAERWRNLASAASVLPLAGLKHPVEVALLRDDAAAPIRAAAVADMRRRITALSGEAGDSVVVLPVLISSGPIIDVTIPTDLKGMPVRYSRAPLAPLAPLARWIERIAESTPDRLTLAE